MHTDDLQETFRAAGRALGDQIAALTRAIVAASLLAARPARGRAVGERKDRPRYPRLAKRMPASTKPGRAVWAETPQYRALAAQLRIEGLRERQAAAGVVWRRTAVVTPAGVVTLSHLPAREDAQ